jgi:hypothetical protein
MRSFFYTKVYVWDVQNILNKEKRKKKRKSDRYRWKGGTRGGGEAKDGKMGRYGQHSNASCEVSSSTAATSRQSAGFFSSRPNWVSPPPHPKKSVATPFGSKGGDTLACCGEGGGSQCDEGTDALVL